MNIEKSNKNIEKDNERITLEQARKNGYNIYCLENYPNDRNHIGVYTDLPCKIEKGRDEFKKNKWHVIFNTYINIEIKTYSTVASAISGSKLDYENYLKKELKNLKNGKLK